VAVVFAEAFTFIDRFTGGGFSTLLAAVGAAVVFYVLANLVYPQVENAKIKMALSFCFAGFECLSAYIMWGILGSLLLGIIPAALVFAGTSQMLKGVEAAKQKAEKEKKYAEKKNFVPGANFVPKATVVSEADFVPNANVVSTAKFVREATPEEIDAELEATAVAI
jgi:predicted phage tail protein